MKNIFVLTAALLLTGLVSEQADAQRRAVAPGTSTIESIPGQQVQPLPKPDRPTSNIPTPAEPINTVHNPYFSRPVEPMGYPSVERLYQNRMAVDTYTPENLPLQPIGPPPSTMQRELSPYRPGTLGGSGY